jgi:hypothetical protein
MQMLVERYQGKVAGYCITDRPFGSGYDQLMCVNRKNAELLVSKNEGWTIEERSGMNFGNIFAYIELAIGGLQVVGVIQHLVSGTTPVSGTDLANAVQPILMGVKGLVPKANIPTELVLDIANGAADAINRYYKKIPPKVE